VACNLSPLDIESNRLYRAFLLSCGGVWRRGAQAHVGFVRPMPRLIILLAAFSAAAWQDLVRPDGCIPVP
jgi:hypothetical protein